SDGFSRIVGNALKTTFVRPRLRHARRRSRLCSELQTPPRPAPRRRAPLRGATHARTVPQATTDAKFPAATPRFAPPTRRERTLSAQSPASEDTRRRAGH